MTDKISRFVVPTTVRPVVMCAHCGRVVPDACDQCAKPLSGRVVQCVEGAHYRTGMRTGSYSHKHGDGECG